MFLEPLNVKRIVPLFICSNEIIWSAGRIEYVHYSITDVIVSLDFAMLYVEVVVLVPGRVNDSPIIVGHAVINSGRRTETDVVKKRFGCVFVNDIHGMDVASIHALMGTQRL